jgi:hypothetical protein
MQPFRVYAAIKQRAYHRDRRLAVKLLDIKMIRQTSRLLSLSKECLLSSKNVLAAYSSTLQH